MLSSREFCFTSAGQGLGVSFPMSEESYHCEPSYSFRAKGSRYLIFQKRRFFCSLNS